MTVAELLDDVRADLLVYIRRNAGWLRRFDTAEDLLQGVQLRALERAAGFEYRGREPFLAWIYKLAAGYLSERRAYWSTLKRRPARLVRITRAAATDASPSAVPEPAGTRTSPSSFAARREDLLRAVRALSAMLPRDRDLVVWTSHDVALDEIAARLGVSYDAAKQARSRALDRFRRAYALVP